jgi:hypothetical protein
MSASLCLCWQASAVEAVGADDAMAVEAVTPEAEVQEEGGHRRLSPETLSGLAITMDDFLQVPTPPHLGRSHAVRSGSLMLLFCVRCVVWSCVRPCPRCSRRQSGRALPLCRG